MRRPPDPAVPEPTAAALARAAEGGVPGEDPSDPSVGTQLSRLIAELAAAPEAEVSAAWQKALAPGDVVGRFRIERELGRGGFGIVFEAADQELGRTVAFKAIRAGSKVAERSEEWLLREAEAVARLHHPNIVTLHDIGKTPTGPYLIFERLRGRTLAEAMRDTRLPVREVVRVATDIARALAHAHAQDVVHRDLKPANVFLCEDGSVKVLDFGLAWLFGRGGPASAGTPAYMAPEQWRSEAGDGRIDLFALGTILFQLLALELPYRVTFKGSDALTAGGAPPLAAREVPAALRRLVLRCIEPDREKRPPNAAVVLRELEEIAARLDGRRRRILVSAAVALTGLAAAGGVWTYENFSTSSGPRVTVAVADVQNETGEPALDGLSGLFITSLEQSRRLQVLSRVRMLDLARQAGRRDAGRIDEATGQEIARQAQARALLLASIHRFEDVYALELRALQPGAQDYVFTLQEKARGRAEIPAAIDRLASRARRELAETKGDLRRAFLSVAQAATPDLDAYGAYYRGLECELHRAGGQSWNSYAEECLPLHRQAVAADPGFALAWYRIALLETRNGASWEGARRALDEALRSEARAPPYERALVRALDAFVRRDFAAARAAYERLVAERPEEREVLFLASLCAQGTGDLAASLGYLERILFLDPTNELALHELPELLGLLERREDLAARLRQWEALPPQAALLDAIVRGRVALGDPAGAVAAARRGLAVAGSPAALEDLVGALFAGGRLAEAEAEIARLERERGGLPPYLQSRRLIAVTAQGRRAEGRRLLDAYVERIRAQGYRADAAEWPATWLAGWADAAALRPAAEASIAEGAKASAVVYLALAGDLPGAERLRRAAPAGAELPRSLPAVVAWKEGRLEEATALLRELDRTVPAVVGPSTVAEPFPAAFLLAEVRAAAGDAAGTVAAVERFHRLWPRGVARGWTWPRSLYLLAQAQERLGRTAEARAAVDRLLDLWKNADAGLPLHAEARALRARLGP